MTPIDDNELEQLMQQYVTKQTKIEDATEMLMHTVRKEIRRATLRRWWRVVLYAFLIPMAMVVYCYVLVKYVSALPQPYSVFGIGLPILTIIVLFSERLRNFTPDAE